MFIKELNLEVFRANASYFEGMTTYFKTPTCDERIESADSNAYRAFTAWVNGTCICVCLCKNDRYASSVQTELLEVRARRFSHLAALNHFKWSLAMAGSMLLIEKEAISHEVLTMLQSLNFQQQVSTDGYERFTFHSAPQTIKEVMRKYLCRPFEDQFGYSLFKPALQEILEQFSPLEVAQAKSFIAKTYTKHYRDIFEMTGEGWDVTYHARFTIFAPTEEDALAQVEKRGFVVKDMSRGFLHKEGIYKYLVWGVRHQRLDHKYNDQSLSYYRHVLTKHIYDYACQFSFMKSFELTDKLGCLLVFHEMKRPFIAPIPKYMESQIQKRALNALIFEQLTPWFSTHIEPHITDCMYPYEVDEFKQLLVEVAKHQKPEVLNWVKQQSEQSLIQDGKTFGYRFMSVFRLFKSTILTPKACGAFFLADQPFEIQFLMAHVLQTLDKALQESEAGTVLHKELRTTCSRLCRKKGLTLEVFESILDDISLEVKELLKGNQRATLFLARYYVKAAIFLIEQNRQDDLICLVRTRHEDWLFNRVITKILELYSAREGEEVLTRYYKSALYRELTIAEFKKSSFDDSMIFGKQEKQEIHDISYILRDFLDNQFLNTEVTKRLLLTQTLKNLKAIHPTLVSISTNYSRKEVKMIQNYLARQLNKEQQLVVEDFTQAELLANKKFINRLGFKGKEHDLVISFLERMNVYNEQKTFSVHGVVRTLGESFFKDCINQSVPSTFTPQTFSYPKSLIGNSIKNILKTKDETVLNPKRLYHRLRQIKPVQSFIEGDFSVEEMELALDQLKIHTSQLDHIKVPNQLMAKVEPKCSPEFLVAGNASVCCMSFGAANSLYYAKQKGFGVLNIYYKERIIANSVLWLASIENLKVLILDNIEVHPNYKRYNGYIRTLYEAILPELKVTYGADFAVQGARYNDLALYNETVDLLAKADELHPIDIEHDRFYSDADSFYILEPEPIAQRLVDRLEQSGLERKKLMPVYDDDDEALPF